MLKRFNTKNSMSFFFQHFHCTYSTPTSFLRLSPNRTNPKSNVLLSEVYGILSDILCIMSTFDFIYVWIHRNRNKDVDALAKQALFAVVSSVSNIGF